jgi:hypothetical protein
LNKKIPFPIKLDEQEQVTRVLQIRKEQLEVAIEMGDWEDAHKTSLNINILMGRVSKKQTDKEIKVLYIEYFRNLAKLFLKGKLYIFHAYALYNIQYLTKSLKDSSQVDRKANNEKLLLATLQIPLNNKITNFKRLPFVFQPEVMKGNDGKYANARDELLGLARIL